MSKFATPNRFEDDSTRNPDGSIRGGTWYKPPPMLIRPDGGYVEMWTERVRVFRELTGLTPAAPRSDAGPKILVAGAGYGFVLWHLWDQGFSPWGIDGAWAVSMARQTGNKLPNISDHMFSGDVTILADVRRVRGDAGIGGQRKFDGLITDDLLSAADSASEVATMLTTLRDVAPQDRSRVLHFITMYDPTQPWSSILTPEEANEGLYRTEAEWVTLIGNNAERIVNINGYRIVR